MREQNRKSKSGNTNGYFVVNTPSGSGQNIVQEIVTKCMFFLGNTDVDYADILDGKPVWTQTEVNN